MSAWGQEHRVGGKVRMLSDTDALFTKVLGMDLDATGILGGTRSKRYSMIVEDGVITSLNVEPVQGKLPAVPLRPCWSLGRRGHTTNFLF